MQPKRQSAAERPRQGVGLAALNMLSFGVVVCNQSGKIVLSNIAADELNKASDGVALQNKAGVIAASFQADTRQLLALVASAVKGLGSGAMRLHDRAGNASFLALISPLPFSVEGSSGEPYAMITLKPLVHALEVTPKTLAQAFGLTPAQASIAIALCDGLSVEEIALQRRGKISTVRTHLADIFSRTQTDNQRDLVRLLSAWPPIKP